MDRSKRLALFVREMQEAAPAATIEEARLLLETRLNAVEDQHSGVPYNPAMWHSDGRLYPPHDDFERDSGRSDIRVFRTVGHRVWFANNGAIRITTLSGRVVLDKPGKDGGLCPA